MVGRDALNEDQPRIDSTQKQQQLHVHRHTLGALGGDEVGNSGERDAVDRDVLIAITAALTHFDQSGCADQRETL